MKTAIKTAVAELLPVLVSRPLESDFTPGDRTVDTNGERFIYNQPSFIFIFVIGELCIGMAPYQ